PRQSAGWLRPAAPREAEGQTHLLHSRRPVSKLLRTRRAHEGNHRREPFVPARAAPGQCRLPRGFFDLTPAGATARQPRSHSGKRSQSRYSLLSSEAWRHHQRARGKPKELAYRGCVANRVWSWTPVVDLRRRRRDDRARERFAG